MAWIKKALYAFWTLRGISVVLASISLISICFVNAALAQDTSPSEETGPNFNQRRELPNPLPPDFNECVVVVWSAEKREEFGYNGGFYKPPHTKEELASIEYGRRVGWGTYTLCDEDDS